VHHSLTLALGLAGLVAWHGPAASQTPSPPAQAQGQPQKPYKPVPVTIASSPRDSGLDALRKDLGDIAKRKDRTALATRIAKDFFWERDFGGNFDAKKPGIDNLTGALGLDADDGGGWEALAAFAAESSAGPLPGRDTAICAPAPPEFDEAARNQLIEESQTDGIEWAYPRASGLQVRAAPQANGAVIETLGLHFVHVLGFEGKQTDADPIRISWARIVTPAGKTGFIAPNSLVSPYADRLCFTKDAGGAWRIAGYVGGGD
jgi:hypothetical protein